MKTNGSKTDTKKKEKEKENNLIKREISKDIEADTKSKIMYIKII